MNSKDLARMQRNRLRIRQTAIFGALVVLVAIAGLASAAMLTDRMEPVFSEPFATPSAEALNYGPTPCPVGASAVYPNSSSVKVNALNASGIRLVAYVAAQTLESRGFDIKSTANASIDFDGSRVLVVTGDQGTDFAGSVLVVTGEKGVNKAYLVLAQAPDDAILAFDGRTDDTVDLIAGTQWDGLKSKDDVKVSQGQTIPHPPGCTEVPELVAANTINPANPDLTPSATKTD